MPRAFIGLRHEPFRRRQAFIQGLETLGYKCIDVISPDAKEINWPPKHVEPDEVLLIWNRGGRFERMALDIEGQYGKVLVTENGYFPAASGDKTYALALTQHNGYGAWHVGNTKRQESLGMDIKPWRRSGKKILVCGQRSIGSMAMGMPQGWQRTVVRKIKQYTDKRIIVREHPRSLELRGLPSVPLKDELAKAFAVVVWSSGCANWALAYGVPVFYCAPAIVCAVAAKPGLEELESPLRGDRSEAFRRLSWAQWTIDEIASGKPFKHLLKGELNA